MKAEETRRINVEKSNKKGFQKDLQNYILRCKNDVKFNLEAQGKLIIEHVILAKKLQDAKDLMDTLEGYLQLEFETNSKDYPENRKKD